MPTTNIIKDIREGTEYAARQWEIYEKAIKRIGHTASLREANEGLGYNLVKTIPGLLQWIRELQDENDRLSEGVREFTEVKAERAERDRPLGIPAGHIVLNLEESRGMSPADLVLEEDESDEGDDPYLPDDGYLDSQYSREARNINNHNNRHG